VRASFLLVSAVLTSCSLGGCGGSPTLPPAGSIAEPNTTLQAETGNNTSTAASFLGQSNGNAPAGNVSKLPISSLLYSGANTKIYATWLSWFGQSNHMSVGYASNSAAQVHAQVLGWTPGYTV
jgi:predicted small lipoprotein YifL